MRNVLSAARIIHYFTLTRKENWLAPEQCRWHNRFVREEGASRYCSPAVITHDLFVTLSHRAACSTFWLGGYGGGLGVRW